MLRFEPTRYTAGDGDAVYTATQVYGSWFAEYYRLDRHHHESLGTFDSSAEAIDACDQHNRAQKKDGVE